MSYAKEALNTISASWTTLMLARLFGHRITAVEGVRRIRLARWRGKTYLIGVSGIDHV